MTSNDPLRMQFQIARSQHWNQVAQKLDHWKSFGESYHRQLAHVYQFMVPPGQRVLEIGCSLGDLLAAVKPAYGVGIDFSWEMIKRAQKRHPEMIFILGDGHNLPLSTRFDIVILSDLVNDIWDVQTLLENLQRLCHPRTRLILNTYSRLWEPTLNLARRLGLSTQNLEQNWFTVEDLTNLLHLTGFEVIKHHAEILLPLPLPGLAALANRFLVRLWPFSLGALTNCIVARPCCALSLPQEPPGVSIIIPARNEAGNIQSILERTPCMGRWTEMIFVEGHSTDDTYAVIEQAIAAASHPCKLLRQAGKGKGDAVRLGFEAACGDIVMILDADLTVPPEDLPRFYEALVYRKGEFVNGVRLVYPLEQDSMRFLNLVGNKLFSLAFSWLLGQPIKDTLCGTKALWRKDYQLIAANRAYFGAFDPFGDFDLLFGAAKLNLKIIDLPIRYRSRTYGATNIHRWRHGWLLIKMMLFAARRLKFI